jgi:hypothetical protein
MYVLRMECNLNSFCEVQLNFLACRDRVFEVESLNAESAAFIKEIVSRTV